MLIQAPGCSRELRPATRFNASFGVMLIQALALTSVRIPIWRFQCLIRRDVDSSCQIRAYQTGIGSFNASFGVMLIQAVGEHQ